MTEVWPRAALWPGLALAATLVSIRLRVATALSEIVVGTVVQVLIGALVGTALLGTNERWITFLSATGDVFLSVSGSTSRRVFTHATCLCWS
jgi:glutathione-regulated potassium-efflux system ancillary protein KefC